MDTIDQPENRPNDEEINSAMGINNSTEVNELSNLIVPDEDQPAFAVEPILDNSEIDKMIGVPRETLHLPFAEDTSLYELVEKGLVTENDIKELWGKTFEIQSRIKDEINKTLIAEELLEKIASARALILTGVEYQKALKLTGLVEHRLSMQTRVKIATRKVVPWLLVYEIACLVGFGMSIFWLSDQSRLEQMRLSLSIGTIDLSQFLATILWGGLGGVVGALYALWKHVADLQDFDKQYSIWYLTNPILGVGLGAFVFLIIQAGFFSLTAGAGDVSTTESAYVIYVFSWISGFKQNVVYELVRRVLDVFRVKTNGEDANKDVSE
jgi:hypothetical protein